MSSLATLRSSHWRIRGLASIYRFLHRALINPCILPRFLSRAHLQALRTHILDISVPQKDQRLNQISNSPLDATTRSPPIQRIWFHAASVGELEALRPVIQRWVQAPTATTQFRQTALDDLRHPALILTVWSESAITALQTLAQQLREQGLRVLYAGFAPLEGQWQLAFRYYRPVAFITYRCEAWWDLWMSAVEYDVNLHIVGAEPRPALHWALVFCRWTLGRLPRIVLYTLTQKAQEDLQREFKAPCEVLQAGDPRWDRVHERMQTPHPRVQTCRDAFALYPKPWGIVGSAWPEDLEVLMSALRRVQSQGPLSSVLGTLWVVPHQLDHRSRETQRVCLEQMGMAVNLTSSLTGDQLAPPRTVPAAVLVDEMGLLLSLYGLGQWVLVGGGFGRGVHSVIEPALWNLPLACGPARQKRFPEIGFLRDSGQLRLTPDAEDLSRWLIEVSGRVPDETDQHWENRNRAQLGASNRVYSQMKTRLNRTVSG